MSRSASFVLTMVRSATTTTTARLEPPSNNVNTLWKRGHVSRGSVGDKIQVIPGFKTSAGMCFSPVISNVVQQQLFSTLLLATPPAVTHYSRQSAKLSIA